MGDHLNTTAQIIAMALFLNDAAIHLAGGDGRQFREIFIHPAFVMANVQVGFAAIFRYIYFAMLVRGHGTGVDVEIRIELDHEDL